MAGQKVKVFIVDDSKRKDRAVRITGCFANEAREVAGDIAEALDGTVAAQAGFVCVWL